MKTLFVFALVMSVWSCSGLPVYDYEPSIMEEALRASIGRVNSRSQWPALFGVVRSYVRGVDLLDNNDYSIVLDFIVRETTCTKDSEKDPSLCDFRMGRYVVSMPGLLAWKIPSDSSSSHTSAKYRENITSLLLLRIPLFIHPKDHINPLGHAITLEAHVQLTVHHDVQVRPASPGSPPGSWSATWMSII
uniref:Secreted phosphoprotein 24 n=1 Tax=Gopherus evgoodei TaxID=1825980 RepID=A0A8C4W0S9_9SAUR